LAQRPLPRTPTRNVGAFRLAPTPPNDSKGRGRSPSPLDSSPRGQESLQIWTGQRQRGKRSGLSSITPSQHPSRQMRRRSTSRNLVRRIRHKLKVHSTPIRSTPATSKEASSGCRICGTKAISFPPGAAAFLWQDKEKRGRISPCRMRHNLSAPLEKGQKRNGPGWGRSCGSIWKSPR